MDILYPIKVNSNSGVSIVFKEIGKRSKHDIHAFADPDFTDDIEGINLYNLPNYKTKKIIEYVRKQLSNFDLIQTCGYPQTVVAPLAKAVQSTNIIHTIHNASEFQGRNLRKFRIRAHRRVMTQIADKVITVSPFVKGHIETHYGRSGTVIPNGVDLSNFSPSVAKTRPDTILYVGRHQRAKHPYLPLKLAQEMHEKEFRLRLDPSREYRASADQVPNVTLLTDRLSREQMARELAQAGALLCPFENEGFGLVVIEAFASGTPVIGYNSGNLPNLIENEKTGLLTDSLQIDEWRNAVRDCDPDLGNAAVEVATRYTWDAGARQYDAVYETVH